MVFGPNGSNGIYGSTVSSGTLTIASGITVDGTTGAIADGYYNSETVINQGTIAADGSGGGADGSITINPTNFTNQGSLEVENGETLYVNGAWTNVPDSTITATGSTLVLGDSQGDAWSNAGTITATNSTVDLGGSFTPAGLGSFTPSETTVNLTGTVNNAGATLAFSAATGSWNLEEERSTAARSPRPMVPSSTFTNSGTLNGVAFDNNLDLATTTAAVTITGGLTLDNANVYLGNTAGSTYGQLDFYGTQTLGGTGTVVFGPNGSNGIYGSTVSSGTLTIASGITVDGTTGAIADGYYNSETVINQGTIAADGSGGGADGSITINPTNFTNQGSLEVENGETLYVNGAWTNAPDSTITATGSTLVLGDSQGDAWSNAGTITATNSTVDLGGSFTPAGLGSFTPSETTVNLTGTVNNAGATLAFSAATGSWNLEGGAIDGGTVTEADGAELTFTNSGTLNGVAFDNNLDLATTTAAVTITGGLTLDNANVYLGNTAGSTYGQLDFYGTQTLGGTGTVVFGPNGSNGIYGSTVLAVRSPSPAVSPSMEPLGRLPTATTTPRR